jgi:hypothetical protein
MLHFDGSSQEKDFDTNMTLQVALKGKDGFVIASDKKASSGSTTEKIFMERDFLCAVSGESTVSRVGRKLLAQLPQLPEEETLQWLEQQAEQFLIASSVPPHRRASLAASLIFAAPYWSASLQVIFDSGIVSCQKTNPAFGGDIRNPALIFFSEILLIREKRR